MGILTVRLSQSLQEQQTCVREIESGCVGVREKISSQNEDTTERVSV
jgi:hypothetical protein